MSIYRSPIEKFPFYMLIETSGSRADHDEEKLNAFLESVMEKGLVLNGTVTNEPTKMKVLFKCFVSYLLFTYLGFFLEYLEPS